MSRKQLYFIGCDNCDTSFGGPEAGKYYVGKGLDFLGIGPLFEYLRAEALSMMRIEVRWGTDLKIYGITNNPFN